ncbi:MAG: methyltransferase domain-containing protein, partial [Candidatus Micrarchaeota archaeon]|nr:methyltransferase domain-containing protein [Candidatus Micrarchaeota archaeon]
DKNGKDRLIVADMTEIPFEDEAFDYCISIASFHHLPKRLHEKGLEEIKRILKPGGECILSVWNKYSFAQPRFWFSPKEKFIPWKRKEKSGSVKAHERYYYLFDWFEISSLVRKNGFQIKKATDFFAENITLLLKKA